MQINAALRGARELQAALADIDRRTSRASMWAVREAGRTAKTAARAAAPVLRGAGTISRKQQRTGGLAVNPNQPVAGLLRASISTGRRLYREGETWSVRVAPRGDRVHLYSGKAELAHQFMAAGHQAATAAFPAIAARAWLRSTRK